jgi:septum site-determining protein MinC
VQLREHLSDRPRFYHNTEAHAVIECAAPNDRLFAEMVGTFAEHGIALRGIYGDVLLDDLARTHGVAYLGAAPPPKLIEVKPRKPHVELSVTLSDGARSLVADFAGARADLASRRTEPRRNGAVRPAPVAAPGPAAAAGATLYHRGTVRGGQSLHHLGNIVVVGDVNPGAELVATGDVVVFGSLRGVAHAGAQGDAAARVAALDFAPTQLRIAAFIAVDDTVNDRSQRSRVAEEARVEDGRIVVAPFRPLTAPGAGYPG